MKKITLFSIFLFGLILLISSCLKEPGVSIRETELNLPEETFNYTDIEFPMHLAQEFARFNSNVFPNSVNVVDHIQVDNNGFILDNTNQIDFIATNQGRIDFGQNPLVTNDGATLGRVLFYDPKLSLNNSVSCASCHKQKAAFSDPARFSKGFGGKITPRNSMAITNSAINNNLFWDSRVHSVSQLVLEPVQNHIEMGMESIEELEKKLAKVNYYPELFAKAFGDEQVSGERIASALSQFVVALVSSDSKFDTGIESGFQNFSALEKLGHELFFSERTQCSGCHAGGNFAAPDFPGGEYGQPGVQGTASIGLDLVSADPGKGNGLFRIPSLRNVALTAPYMHDGRFNSLEEVIDHYNSGIQAHPELDTKLQDENGLPRRMSLNSLEKKALVAFLHTLTDSSLIVKEKYSDPFRY